MYRYAVRKGTVDKPMKRQKISYLTSFLVNNPTLSSCSSSGILSSIRRWTISAILSTQMSRFHCDRSKI